MSISLGEQDLKNFVIIGERILIKPSSSQQKTKTGLYLPPTVQENEKLLSGYVMKVGPGFPIPAINDYEEPWKDKSDQVKYVPLQARVGDLAVYLSKSGYEIEFNGEKYIILSQSAVLLLIRDEKLFK